MVLTAFLIILVVAVTDINGGNVNDTKKSVTKKNKTASQKAVINKQEKNSSHSLNKEELITLNPNRSLIIHNSHRGSLGLTYQLARVVELILRGCRDGAYVREHHFRLDYSKEDYGELDDVIDIDKTNANLGCTRLIKNSEKDLFKRDVITMPDVQIMSKSIRSSLALDSLIYQKIVFADDNNTTFVSFDTNRIPRYYYSIHFRMEMDWIVSRASDKLYHKWLNLIKISNSTHSIDSIQQIEKIVLNDKTIRNRIYEHIHEYEKLAIAKFKDKSYPIIIATGLGKNDPANIRCEWTLVYFLKLLQDRGYEYILGSSISPYRDVQAVADIKMMVNSVNCIIDNVSTFALLINIMRGNVRSKRGRGGRIPCISVPILRIAHIIDA